LKLIVGVDVDASISVDTKPAQEVVVNTANTVVKETTKVVEKVAEPVKDAGKTVVGGAKDVGNTIGGAVNHIKPPKIKKPKLKF
jgi:hypothetical protein